MVASIIILALVAVILVLVTFQLLRQQGRILLRLDALEKGLDGAKPSEPQGLPIGTPVPDFQLRDIASNHVAFSSFRGKRVLLLYWNPECGFCDMSAADLAKMQPGLKKSNTELVFLSFGTVDANKKLLDEHGLSCPVLLVEEGKPSAEATAAAEKVFAMCGTPAACLIDEEGLVAGPLAIGTDEVLRTARECVKATVRKLPLTQSRIEREGLKPGVHAPSFSLPSIDGKTVSLEEFRGQKVLLVFSDPQCGPCDELAPHLVGFHRKHRNNGLAVVMVGRGNEEQNRKKVADFGVEFPVVLQERWKLSKEYGIFATPVAFLISKDGVILKHVARGADEIMQLARESVASGKE